MKKIALALIFLALTSIMVTTIIATTYFLAPENDVAFMQMASDGVSSCMVINSPATSGPFQTSSIDISLDYYLLKNLTQINSFSYNLDEHSNSTLRYFSRQTSDPFPYYVDYHIFGTLKNLANNDYWLTIYAHFVNGTVKSIYHQPFTVNTSFVYPKLTVIAPQNHTTYNPNKVPITYHINAKVIYSYYALDKTGSLAEGWVLFNGNTTLTGLSQGSHSIIISVNSETGEQTPPINSEQTIYFNIDASKQP